jgi:signal transduction histidine kinase
MKFLPYLLILLLCINCRPGNSDEINNDITASNDSISVWIKQLQIAPKDSEKAFKLGERIKKNISTLPSDSMKGKLLSELSLVYFSQKDSTNFKKANRNVIDYALRNNDSIRLAEGYWDKGAFYSSPSIVKRDSALLYLFKAHKIYTKLGRNINSARVLKDIAIIQTKVHDNTGAIVTLIQVIEKLKPYKENHRLYEAYNILGVAAAALGEYDEAVKYYITSREYLSIDPTKLDHARLSNNLGMVYLDAGKYELAHSEFQNALNTDSLLLNSPVTYARVLGNLAMVKLATGHSSSAEEDLFRALSIRDSIGDLEGLSLNYYQLAQYYHRSGNNVDAFVYAGNAMDLAKEIDNNLRYLESLKLMAELDPKNAASYYTEYVAISDSLQREERRIRNKFDRIRFETDETLAENEQLSKQKLIWTGVALGVLLFAMALFIIVIQRIKNQRLKFQQQQQEANQEIFNLMLAQKQKVEEGKQSEQKRISEELHDGILGEMNGVRMILLGLNKKGDDAAISLREQAIEKLKEVQEEIRSISHELNDTSYQKFNNFMNSIEELLNNVCDPAGIKYHFTYDHDLDWDSLEGITKINLYRILQESLQNCIKHAAASSIYVAFEIKEDKMVITIQDNGRGFDTAKSKKGIGHKNIKSRVNKIKGRWYLRSAPGIGTTVLLEIPLEHISQEAKKEISLPKDLQEVELK